MTVPGKSVHIAHLFQNQVIATAVKSRLQQNELHIIVMKAKCYRVIACIWRIFFRCGRTANACTEKLCAIRFLFPGTVTYTVCIMCVYVYAYVFMCVYMHICVYVYMHVYMCVFMCIY